VWQQQRAIRNRSGIMAKAGLRTQNNMLTRSRSNTQEFRDSGLDSGIEMQLVGPDSTTFSTLNDSQFEFDDSEYDHDLSKGGSADTGLSIVEGKHTPLPVGNLIHQYAACILQDTVLSPHREVAMWRKAFHDFDEDGNNCE
jgi:hypothetical protein